MVKYIPQVGLDDFLDLKGQGRSRKSRGSKTLDLGVVPARTVGHFDFKFNRSYALGTKLSVAARSYRASEAAPRRRLRRRGRYDAAATVFS